MYRHKGICGIILYLFVYEKNVIPDRIRVRAFFFYKKIKEYENIVQIEHESP